MLLAIVVIIEWWMILIVNILIVVILLTRNPKVDYDIFTPLLGCGFSVIATLIIWLLWFIIN